METLQEKIDKLRNEELKRLRELLQPYFKGHGIVVSKHNTIFLQRKDLSNTILTMNQHGRFCNSYHCVYENNKININDVFEEVGENLEEIKVKPIRLTNEFDAEEWKRDFAKRYNLSTSENDNEVIMNSGKVIDRNLDVNHNWWHRELFAGKHKLFKFDCRSRVRIDSQELADEFERAFIIMRDYLENVPNLNKGADNDK